MIGYEMLDYFGKTLGLLASLFVVAVRLRGYQRTGITPLLILGISACLSIVALVIDLLFLRRAETQSTLSTLWISTMVLWILDILLYAVGICLLVSRYVLPGAKPNEPSET
ncbi:MAG: hypothetical protein AAF491_08355 [Verrucomicrobiota bacterium]